MSESQDRYFELLATTVVIVLCAYFLARGATVLASDLLFAPAEDAPVSTFSPGFRGTSLTRKDANGILRRNIFDAQTGPLDGSAVEVGLPTENAVAMDAPIDPENPPPACSGALKLVGSLFWGAESEDSIAAIRSSAGKLQTYRVGEKVDNSEVAMIRSGWVAVRMSTGACTLRMFAQGATQAPAPAPAPRVAAVTPPPARGPRPARRGQISDEDYAKGIQKNSDTAYSIRRSLVDKLLTNQAELMRSARVVPYEENGKTVGIKLYGIRSTSMLSRIGLLNADMLKTINGFDMSRPDSALEAYTKLRSADRLSLSIVRGGKPVTLNYTIN